MKNKDKNSLTPQPIKVDELEKKLRGLTMYKTHLGTIDHPNFDKMFKIVKNHLTSTIQTQPIKVDEEEEKFISDLTMDNERYKREIKALKHDLEQSQTAKNIQRDKVQQLKSKADRDLKSYNKNEIEYLDKIETLKQDVKIEIGRIEMLRKGIEQRDKELTEIKEKLSDNYIIRQFRDTLSNAEWRRYLNQLLNH